jgi:4-hydroxy-tetrahydrodipicolinate synthase
VPASVADLVGRIRGGLLPAVPVPWSNGRLDETALAGYVEWMARHPVAGVAVGVHTGRGRHLDPADRKRVLTAWRNGCGDRVIVAGAWDDASAAEAKDLGADAVLAFPRRDDPVGYHRRLGEALPVIVFYLYEAAGGVAWPLDTVAKLLSLPSVLGIKIATLDSVMTFQDLAVRLREQRGKVLITGEDRFLGYSLLLGAEAALIGMGAALPDLQAELLRTRANGEWSRFIRLSALCDELARVTFRAPMEGYVRRMLWAAAADGAIPREACEDPWGPALPAHERDEVEQVVRRARSAFD